MKWVKIFWLDSKLESMTHSHTQPSGLSTHRGEYKVPGGKLVAVGLGENVGDGVHIDGDFFIDGVDDPTAVVALIEQVLSAGSGFAAMEAVAREFPEAQCVGLTAQALDKAMARARGQQVESAQAAANTTSEESVDELSFTSTRFSLSRLLTVSADQPCVFGSGVAMRSSSVYIKACATR